MNRLFLLLFGAVTLVANAQAQVPNYVPTEGLVAWLSFESADSSLTSFAPTQGNYTSVPDRFGELSAARFTDQAIVMESETDSVPSGSFTFSFWAFHEGQEQFSTAIHPIWGQTFGNGSSHAGCGIWMHGTQLKLVEHSANYVRTAVTVVENFFGWHMITVVYQSNEMQVYRDGMLVAANTDNGRLIHAPLGRDEYSNYVNFGVGMGFGPSGSTSTPNVFQGVLDDYVVWNRVLSDEEIAGMIESEIGCTDPTACNFDAEASLDDGSCIPSGCMEPLACNYNALAECEGEACDYTCCPGPGCCLDGTNWDAELGGCVPDDANDPSDPTANSCPQDLDFNGVVGVGDLMDLLSVFGTNCPTNFTCGDPITYTGYDYATVQIGEQCWFAENLRTEQFRNGEDISFHSTDEEWLTGAPARCAPDSNIALVSDYGWLYNGYAVNDERALCPVNWHVSTDADWGAMETLVGIEDSLLFITGHRCNTGLCALALKSSPEDSPSWTGTNETGFSAIPSGQRQFSDYNSHQVVSTFWCNESGPFTNYLRELNSFNSGGIYRGSSNWYDGRSVRCVKD